MRKTCQKCGSSYYGNICSVCTKNESATNIFRPKIISEWTCPNCQYKNPNTILFCERCSTKMNYNRKRSTLPNNIFDITKRRKIENGYNFSNFETNYNFSECQNNVIPSVPATPFQNRLSNQYGFASPSTSYSNVSRNFYNNSPRQYKSRNNWNSNTKKQQPNNQNISWTCKHCTFVNTKTFNCEVCGALR